MARKKHKNVKAGSMPFDQVGANSASNVPSVTEKAPPETLRPVKHPTVELSPLTIALQKERGVYKKRRPHCPPQNRRWSDEYNGPLTKAN